MERDGAQAVRILLVDDHPTMRTGLAMLLSHVGYTICGEAENRAELLVCLDAAPVDAVVLDLSLAAESGFDLLDMLRSRNISVLVYSMHDDWTHIERAFDRGALGYVTKREGAAVLLAAIRQVVAGKRYISPGASCGLSGRVLVGKPFCAAALSSREEQIMDLLGRGETNSEIAASLHISDHTVQTYFTRLIEKLGLPGMKDLRKLAIQRQK